jgi:hypothetical protein
MQKLHVILEIHGQFQDSGISRISCDRSTTGPSHQKLIEAENGGKKYLANAVTSEDVRPSPMPFTTL